MYIKQISLLACLVLGACNTAQVPLADTASDLRSKQFTMEPDKGAIYVYRTTDIQSGPFDITINKETTTIGNHSYLVSSVDPGTYDIRCRAAGNIITHSVTVGAGHTVFVKAYPGIAFGGPTLCVMEQKEQAEGKAAVLRGRRALPLN